MDIENVVEEIRNAWVEYACDTAYITKFYMSDNESDGDRYLISDDGTEHCGYLVVKDCSFGTFWFDLYTGIWESKDDNVQGYLHDPSVKAELNRRFSDVAKCLGPQSTAVNEKEVWRKIISLHLQGDYSLASEIDVMSHDENASSMNPARFSKKDDKSWDIKSLSCCIAH